MLRMTRFGLSILESAFHPFRTLRAWSPESTQSRLSTWGGMNWELRQVVLFSAIRQ